MHLLRDADHHFAFRHDLRVQQRARFGGPAAAVGRENLEHRGAKLVDLPLETPDALLLGRRIQHRNILLERAIDGGVRVLQLAAIGGGRRGVGIEQRIANVNGSNQHLRADRRQQLLRLHVPRIDRRGTAFDVAHAFGEVIAREQPDAERQAKGEQQGRFEREPFERFTVQHREHVTVGIT